MLEHAVLIAPILKVEPRHRHPLTRRRTLVENDDAIDVRIRQRPEHHTVEHAEHRGVRADAERKRQHGHDREAFVLQQHADGVAEILNQGIHLSSKGRC